MEEKMKPCKICKKSVDECSFCIWDGINAAISKCDIALCEHNANGRCDANATGFCTLKRPDKFIGPKETREAIHRLKNAEWENDESGDIQIAVMTAIDALKFKHFVCRCEHCEDWSPSDGGMRGWCGFMKRYTSKSFFCAEGNRKGDE